MKVLITKTIPSIASKMLQDSGISVTCPSIAGMSYDEILSEISDYDAVITMLADKIDTKILSAAQKLKVVANFAVGYNNLDISAMSKKNIIATNTPDVLTEATAELALALLLATSRKFKEAQQFIRDGHWKRWETMELLGPSLNTKTLGIYGMGRIGESFAKKCEVALGMRVIYCNRHEKKSSYEFVSFDSLIERSDVISIHSPLTEETKNKFDKKVFQKMKPSSILINTSRGEICHTEDLLGALKENQIWAAGLDVTSPEPLDPLHELYQLNNCLILPHIGSATIETRNEMAKLCALNVINVLQGKEPLTPVKI